MPAPGRRVGGWWRGRAGAAGGGSNQRSGVGSGADQWSARPRAGGSGAGVSERRRRRAGGGVAREAIGSIGLGLVLGVARRIGHRGGGSHLAGVANDPSTRDRGVHERISLTARRSGWADRSVKNPPRCADRRRIRGCGSRRRRSPARGAGRAGSVTTNVVPDAERARRPRPCRGACRRSTSRSRGRARCRCRGPRWRASRGRTARRSSAARRARSRRRCRGPRSGAPSPPATTQTSTGPPRGVNLIALPTRFVTTWPIRCGSWRIRIGAAGSASRSSRLRRRARGRGLLDGRLDRDPQVVGPEVEQDEPGIELRELEQVLGEPVEALELDAARVEELRPGDRVVAGPLGEQLVERQQRGDRRPQLVRDVGQEVAAAVAIAADDLDALLEPGRPSS